MSQFLALVERALEAQDGPALAQLLPFNERAMQQLRSTGLASQLPHAAVQARLVRWGRHAVQLVESYTQCLYEQGDGLFDALTTTFGYATSLFSAADNGWLGPMLKQMARDYVQLALRLDTGQGTLRHAEEASRGLFRLFNVILSERVAAAVPKRTYAMFVANALFRLYFHMGQLRMCASVHQSLFANASVSFDEYCAAERVAYRYYLGRLYLGQFMAHRAYWHLLYAFRACHRADYSHRRKILIQLIPAALVLGIAPNRVLICEAYDLWPAYGPLISAARTGDFMSYRTALHDPDRRPWYLKHGVYLLLNDRIDMIMFRMLFRKTFLATYQPTFKTTYVECAKLLDAYWWSVARRTTAPAADLDPDPDPDPDPDIDPDIDLDLDDIECVCTNLLDEGYVKGYIMRSQKILVLKKDANYGFQLIKSVVPPAAPDGDLAHFKDRPI